MVKNRPKVSILIPTYNAQRYLARCLQSIKELDYPKNKIEVIIADGGSNDNTIEIAKNYSIKIVQNPRRTAEYGKKIAFDRSTGSIIALIDADNVIASRNWLNEMLQPLRDKRILGVESNYLLAQDFSSLNVYANSLIIVDPLARMLASKPTKTSQKESYLIKEYSRYSRPVGGANGFLWKREILTKKLGNRDEFNESLILTEIARTKKVYIANIPGIGIYHYYCSGLRDYINKRRKIARKHLSRSKESTTWVSQRGTLRLIFASLYLATFIGPLTEALWHGLKQRRAAWLWHPVISFLTIVVYSVFDFIDRLKNSGVYSEAGAIKTKSFLILSHHGQIEGAVDYLEQYLLTEKHSVLKLSHPLNVYNDNSSTLTKNKKQVNCYERRGSPIANLLIDALSSLYIVLRYRTDYIIGANNFDCTAAIAGTWLCFWRDTKVYYFGSDFSMSRFNNKIMNGIYLHLERFCNRYANVVISNTNRAQEKRLKLSLSEDRSVVIPNGVTLEKAKFRKKQIMKNNYVYVGNVNKEHGLLELLQSIAPLIKKLVIIGHGEDWRETIQYCRKLGFKLETHQKKTHAFVIDYLQNFCGYGLAPYRLDRDYIYYGSSLKLVEYIACGVPAITSDATELAKYLDKEKLGLIYSPMQGEYMKLKKELDQLDTTNFNRRAEEFYEKFNHKTLFSSLGL